MYCIRIAQAAERLRLNKLLTLTLDPAKIPCATCGYLPEYHAEFGCAEYKADSTRYINGIFADFRVYLRRKFGKSISYIRVLEYQKNGNAHLHILVGQFIAQEWVSEAWAAIGGGRIVDIRRVDLHRISHYLSKYLTKQMILLAPERARRVTTSRDIHLLERGPREYQWLMLRCPILRVFDYYREQARNIQPDTDGYLVSFEVFESPTDPSVPGGGNAGAQRGQISMSARPVHRTSTSTAKSQMRGHRGVGMAVNEWDRNLMDVSETAQVLHVPISWVYERTRRRGKERIPHIKLGKYLRFEATAVRSWLNGLKEY